MNGRAKKGIQWGAIATGMGILVGLATYFGCLPIVRSEMSAHELREDAVHLEFYHNQKHVDSDLGRLLNHYHLEHDDEALEPPTPMAKPQPK